MPVRPPNVPFAGAPSDSRLELSEVGLDSRTNGGHDGGAVEASQAVGELQRPLPVDCVSIGLFGYPDE